MLLLGFALARMPGFGGHLHSPEAFWQPPSGLHRLHSGHLGDHVAWLLFGTPALTALLV